MQCRDAHLLNDATNDDGCDARPSGTSGFGFDEGRRGVEGGTVDSSDCGQARANPANENPVDHHADAGEAADRPDRYHGLPVVVIHYADGTTQPAPFLMRADEVAAFFRLHESKTKFPEKTIQRYRRIGLRTVRVGRRVWFRLDDVLRFLDDQQDRLRWA